MHPTAEVCAERAAELLERLNHLLAAQRRRAAASAGQREVHTLALEYLARANRYSDTPQAVADYLGLTKGTVSQTLLRLRERGWLTERSDPQDGRRRHLELTPEGRDSLEASCPSAALRQALGDLGPSAAFVRELERLLAGFQEHASGRRFGACTACRHRVSEASGTRCGLTRDPLEEAELDRLCCLFEPGE